MQLTPGSTDSHCLLAVAATFTADPVVPALAFWMRELDLECQIRLAPYNQVFQQLLDPASLLSANRQGVGVVLVRFEDWDGTSLEQTVAQLAAALGNAGRTFGAPLVVVICPASPHFDGQRQRSLEDLFAARLEGTGAVYLVRPAEIDALYPVAAVHDLHADELGHVPYTPEYFAALATLVARRVHALRVAPYKVVALDCDDTLWRGICGEDGPQGVVLDAPRLALQRFLAAQHDAGMLLALASKNNLEDVLDTFRMHPEMPLRPDHFVAMRVNWEPKGRNLAALAEELELDLASFLFVDDSPKECTEVAAHCPEVTTLPLPAGPEEMPAFLAHVWAFDHPRITEEDRRRTEMYAQRLERGRAERQAASLGEFLASLDLRVEVAPLEPEDLPRAAQLTQRTNQMNFTTVRRSEAEMHALAQTGEAECLAVRVSDRFGSYGLAGLTIFRVIAREMVIDTFLLSCRALGRGVEHRMLAALGRLALERKLETVIAPFSRTPRNLPALLLLESVGLPYGNAEAGLPRFRFPAGYAAGLVYKPDSGRPARAAGPAGAAAAPTRRAIDYVRIAGELRDPARVAALVAPAPCAAAAGRFIDAPRTDLERRLADIWAGTLSLPRVGIHENFFDLGGHSLLAVQLLSRVRQELEVDLSLEIVYTGDFTVAGLAKAIELKHIELMGQYADLLRELESLSDEAVRALLAEEDPEAG